MRIAVASILAVAILAAACGRDEPARGSGADAPPRKPVRTFADDTIRVKDKARDRTEAAIDTHREALDQRVREDEGASAGDAPAEPAGD